MSSPADKLVADLAKSIKLEDAAADRYARSNMSATLGAAYEKRKAVREGIERAIVAAKEGKTDWEAVYRAETAKAMKGYTTAARTIEKLIQETAAGDRNEGKVYKALDALGTR